MVWFNDKGHWQNEYYADVLDTPYDWGVPADETAAKHSPQVLMHDGLEEDKSFRGQLSAGVLAGRQIKKRSNKKVGEMSIVDLAGQVLQSAPASDIFAAMDTLISGYKLGKSYQANKKKKVVSGDYIPPVISKKLDNGAKLYDFSADESFTGKMGYQMEHEDASYSYVTFSGDSDIHRINKRELKINSGKGVIDLVDGKWSYTMSADEVKVSDEVKEKLKKRSFGKNILENLMKSKIDINDLDHASDVNEMVKSRAVNSCAIAQYKGFLPNGDSYRHYFNVGAVSAYIDTCDGVKFDYLEVGSKVPINNICSAGREDHKTTEMSKDLLLSVNESINNANKKRQMPLIGKIKELGVVPLVDAIGQLGLEKEEVIGVQKSRRR